MKSRYLLLIVICVLVGCVFCGLLPVAAIGDQWESPAGDYSSSGGGGGSSGTLNCEHTRVNESCTGYSWLFFEAIGPKVSIVFKPDHYDGRENPVIPDTCADRRKKEMGFWHMGRNAVTYGDRDYFNARNENSLMHINENADYSHNYTFSFSTGGFVYNGDVSYYNFGHMATYDKNYASNSRRHYVERYRLSDFSDLPNSYRWGFSKFLESPSTRGQILYRRINGVYTPIYRAMKIKSEANVLVEYNEAFDKNASSIPGWVYAFCHWHIPTYSLKAIPVNESNNWETISSIPEAIGIARDESGNIREEPFEYDTVTVTRNLDTSGNYMFMGWKLLRGQDYVKSFKEDNGPNYVSGTKGLADNSYSEFNIRSITGKTTVYAVYKKISLKAKMVDMKGNSLSSLAGLGDVTGRVNADGLGGSVGHGRNDSYHFVCWKLSKSGDCVNSNDVFTVEKVDGEIIVYAAFQKVSLVAKAVDENGKCIGDKISDVSATGVVADGPVSVTRREDNRYIFLGFKQADSCADTLNKDWVPKNGSNYYVSGGKETEFDDRDITFNVRNLSDQEVVYAVYQEKSSFLGQILVNGTVVVSPNSLNGYTDKSEKQTINIENCSPVDGCDVTFTHNMYRKSGDKKVDYVISRTSNYWNNGLGVEPKILKTKKEEDFDDVGNGGIKQLYNDAGLKLYPGQVVCEKLSFKPFVWKNDEIVLEACASALGNAQPDDPVTPGNPDTPWDDPDDDNLNGAAAFLKLEVKNENVSKYNTYRRIIYAKPSDKVKFRATYNPILQYTAYLMPQQMKIDSGSAIFPSTGTNTKSFMKDLFNANKGSSLKNWNNAFYVNGISGIFKDKCSDNGNECIFNVGDSAKKTKESSSFMIQTNHVGQELKETAITNKSDKVKTTPSQVSFVSNGAAKINLGNVITSDKVSDAMVRVPYNYDNEICVRKDAAQGTECMDSSESLGTFGAGERVRGAYQISVKPKINEKIDKNEGYATIVPEAKSKIIIYKGSPDVGGDVSGDDICRARYGMAEDGVSCWYSDEKTYSGSNSLNAEGNLEKGATKIPEFILNIPDVDAGTSYCIAAAVYPASSIEASDANYATNSMAWADKEGNHMWRVSRSVCFTVGKKPTFQVWGGSFYGANDIKVSSTVKNNLTLPSGNVKVDGGVIVFSSWVEQTVVAKGKVENLASGASTGLAANQAGGGSLEPSDTFCGYRVPLSIANNGNGICPDYAYSGESGISAPNNKEVFTEIANEDKNGTIERITNQNVLSNATLGLGSGLASGTKIIEYDGDITIIGDITYADTAQYSDLNTIPKIIIYAKGVNHDISINCGVRRVDAILLADDIVYTCNNYSGKKGASGNEPAANQPERSNQLVINGAIFTNKLELGRTYGMGTGTYSKIPAEIINYDASIILWAKGKTDKDDFEKLHQVYINELAPRY